MILTPEIHFIHLIIQGFKKGLLRLIELLGLSQKEQLPSVKRKPI